MRVAIDVSAVPAQPVGAGQYVAAVVEALAARGETDLTLVARRDDAPRWASAAPLAVVRPVAPLRRPLRLAWEQLLLPRVVRTSGVDLHHGPHYTMPERSRVPVVVTIHDMTFFDHPHLHERMKVPFFQRAIRVASRRAAALVCVSDRTAERLQSRLAPRVPVHVIPHGVDHGRFHPPVEEDDDHDRRTLQRLGVRPPYLAFLGTLEPRKNVPGLIRAWSSLADRHTDLTLVLAGRPGWGAEEVDAAMSASAHRERILRTGYVSDSDAAVLLRHASCVAYPAFDEGFGLPALEALASGAPLVTTTGTPMADFAGSAALTVPAGDDDALADAIAAVLTETAATERRRIEGLERAAEFTWEAAAAAHERVYASTVR